MYRCEPRRGGGQMPMHRPHHSSLQPPGDSHHVAPIHKRRRCWLPHVPAGRPGFEGGEPSLPAPKSPTYVGRGAPTHPFAQAGHGAFGSWGPLRQNPPGSWARARSVPVPSARPAEGRWRLHASRALRDLTCATAWRGRAGAAFVANGGGRFRQCDYGQTAPRSVCGVRQGRAGQPVPSPPLALS